MQHENATRISVFTLYMEKHLSSQPLILQRTSYQFGIGTAYFRLCLPPLFLQNTIYFQQ